jgi:holo-[acyl-carrier protein] synthase
VPVRARARVGIDVVGIERVARLVDENEGILDRLFSPREQAYCLRRRRVHAHLAERFAAKEAVLKAMGTGLGPRMRWTDVEIVAEPGRRPAVELHGEAAAYASRRRLVDVDVSLSHTSQVALAQAVTVWEEQDALPPD